MPIIRNRDFPDLWADPALHALDSDLAARQDVRPLRIVLINLAPDKTDGDLRIARLLSNSAMQVELTVVRDRIESDQDVSPYLLHFYRSSDEVRLRPVDGVVVIGPTRTAGAVGDSAWMREWAATSTGAQQGVGPELYVGGAALDAIRSLHGIHPRHLASRRRGLHWHQATDPSSGLLRGHDRSFVVPVSDPNGIAVEDLAGQIGFTIVAQSPDAGVHILRHDQLQRTFLINDITLDAEALGWRRRSTPRAGADGEGRTVQSGSQVLGWGAHAQLVIANWLTHDVLPVTVPGRPVAPGQPSAGSRPGESLTADRQRRERTGYRITPLV